MKHFEHSLPMMLYRTLDVVMPRFRRIFSEFGLTEQQWRVLRVLWENDGCALLELAKATLIQAPSLVGIVDRLERDGLVQRCRSTSDRRVVRVKLTESGKKLEEKVSPRVNVVYAELEASISRVAWQQMTKGMDQLITQNSASNSYAKNGEKTYGN